MCVEMELYFQLFTQIASQRKITALQQLQRVEIFAA